MPGTGAVILAAGGSSRLGRPKQLLQFAGQTLLARSVATALGAGCEPVVVVLGAQFDRIHPHLSMLAVTAVHNPQWQKGIGTSIRCGMGALLAGPARPDEVVMMLCDQPLVDSPAVARLLRAYRASGRTIAVSVHAGTPGPPVILSADFFPELLALGDDQGAKAIWSGRPEIVCPVECAEAGFDIDTEDDAKRLDRLAREDSGSGIIEPQA